MRVGPLIDTDGEIPHHERGAGPGGAFVVGPGLLAAGTPGGPLSGLRFAVKDLFDVARTRTGAGNPDFLADAPVATRHASAVAALVAAGADLVGKTVTDELAYSLSGTNVHYGTPVNPAAPGHVPGGSSSGSAVAVATGAVDFALGTDTGGSVRVPASYCGIYGIRPSHGRIPIDGVVPLSPSFDTVGVFARDPALLQRAFVVFAPEAPEARPPRRLLLADALFGLGDAATRRSLERVAIRLGTLAGVPAAPSAVPDEAVLEEMAEVYSTVQMAEAWAAHGAWIAARRPRFGPGVAARFARAAALAPGARAAALSGLERARALLQDLVGEGGVLVQPAAVSGAPPYDLDDADKDELRRRTLLLTAFASSAGAPVVVVPAARVAGLPVGLALVGAPGSDESLITLAILAAHGLAGERSAGAPTPS